MKHFLFILSLVLAFSGALHATDDAAIIDGPNYAFTISGPKGWKLTSTRELQAAFHPADTKFEKSAVVMYARSADKKQLGVSNIPELNRLDLKGIQGPHPAAKSEKVGSIKTARGMDLPLYSFTGGGYSELVAYAEQEKTITVLVISAETDEQLKTARPAFEEMLSSYVFLTDAPKAPKKPANPAKKRREAK